MFGEFEQRLEKHCKMYLIWVISFMIFVGQNEGFLVLMSLIPNGNSVPHPCRPGLWPGVGHLTSAGGGQTNVFGTRFELNRLQWSWRFCRQDSDGDGRSNGLELGDPTCTWRPGRRPRWRATGHPGFCEPVNSFRCRNQISPCGGGVRNIFRGRRF